VVDATTEEKTPKKARHRIVSFGQLLGTTSSPSDIIDPCLSLLDCTMQLADNR
jgi:hypothetical protein